MDLLNLYVRVGAKDEASPAINDISSNIIGKLGSAAKTAAQALAGAFAVKKVVDFGKAAFDAYSEYQQLAGGVEKIFDEIDNQRVLDDATNAFINLNMSANEYLAAINQTGAMFSQTMGDEKGYETAKAGMQAISDYATGTGRDINELNQKFAAITRSTGSYQSIADQFAGILPATSKDFLEQAKAAGILADGYEQLTDVPVAEYQEAVTKMLEKGVADLGLTGNTFNESLGTLSGSILATQSAWKNLVAEFGKPDADIGARISDMMYVLLGNGGNGLIHNVVVEVGHIARNMISALADAIGSGADWLLSNGADALRDGIEGMVSKIGDVTEVVKNLPSIDIGELLFGRSEGGDGILARVGDLITDASEIIYEHMPDIQAAFGGLWEALTTYIAERGPEILASIGEVLSGIGEWLITWWPEIQGWLADTWLSLMEWLYSNGPEILQTIGEIIDSIVSWLWENAPLILQAVGETMMNVVMAIAEHAPEILTSIAEMVGTVIGYLIEHAGEFLIAAGDWIAQMVQGIQDKGPEILTWFQELPQNILNALGDLSTLLLDAGAQIVSGLVQGITDNIGNAGQALLDGIGGAVDGALSFLGINSPSKLFDWMGQMSMEGLAGGIEDAAAKAEAATASAVKGVYGAASGTIDVSMAPSGNNAILAALGEIRDNMNMSVMLDSGALVGGIAPQMNTALGGIY